MKNFATTKKMLSFAQLRLISDIKLKKMELAKLIENKKNPRLITDSNMSSLVRSLKEFPEMMYLRPIVVNSKMEILGGNMRFRALQILDYKNIPDEWVKIADGLTNEECDFFLLEDNLNIGDWDVALLSDLYDQEELDSWTGGILELPDFDLSETQSKNKREKQLKECPFCGFIWKE